MKPDIAVSMPVNCDLSEYSAEDAIRLLMRATSCDEYIARHFTVITSEPGIYEWLTVKRIINEALPNDGISHYADKDYADCEWSIICTLIGKDGKPTSTAIWSKGA